MAARDPQIGPRSAPVGTTSGRGAELAHVVLPIPRDRLLHLWVGTTMLVLAVAAVLAHAIGVPAGPLTARVLAWMPVLYGPPAALASFYLALRRRPGRWAYRLHAGLMAGAWVLGGLGALVHAAAAGRAAGLWGLLGSGTLAPLAFAAAGTVGWIAAWSDEALGVGRAPDAVVKGRAPAVPGREALLWSSAAGFALLTVVTLADHLPGGLTWGESVAIAAAGWSLCVAVATLAGLGGGAWQSVYVWSMLANVVVGFAGLAAHLSSNMFGPPAELLERMILAAPIGSPLAYAALGLLGLLAVAEPAVDPLVLEQAWPPRRRT